MPLKSQSIDPDTIRAPDLPCPYRGADQPDAINVCSLMERASSLV